MLVGVFSGSDSRGGFLGIAAPEGSGEGVLGQRQMFILATGPPQLGVWLELGQLPFIRFPPAPQFALSNSSFWACI